MSYKTECTLDVGRLCFVEEIDVVLAHELYELTVDVLQGLIVRLQRFDQLWLAIDDLLRHNGIAYPFKSTAPLRDVRPFVWCAQEQYAKC